MWRICAHDVPLLRSRHITFSLGSLAAAKTFRGVLACARPPRPSTEIDRAIAATWKGCNFLASSSCGHAPRKRTASNTSHYDATNHETPQLGPRRDMARTERRLGCEAGGQSLLAGCQHKHFHESLNPPSHPALVGLDEHSTRQLIRRHTPLSEETMTSIQQDFETIRSLTLTIPQAAQLLGISVSKAYEAARLGERPTVRVGTRPY